MTEPHYQDDRVTLYHGDSLNVLGELPDASVDAVVTDPPYGIRFMGQAWDGADIQRVQARNKESSPMPAGVGGPNGGYRSLAAEAGRYNTASSANRDFQAWVLAWAVECLRILKPGGHLLASGSPRTWHRLASGIEDAGFEIRDSIAWLYGSGFPKSLNVAKAIATGGRPEDIRRAAMGTEYSPSGRGRVNYDHGGGSAMNGDPGEVPLSAEAEQWQGWGTALKPAFEPIVVGRKPLAGTVATNVLAHGTGALNIDACRTATGGEQLTTSTVPNDMRGGHYGSGHRPGSRDGEASADRRYSDNGGTNFAPLPGVRGGDPAGRWPTNVVLDDSQAEELDRQSGILTSGANLTRRGSDKFRNAYGEFAGQEECTPARGADSGGASRFFPTFRYEAKAPAAERPVVDGVAHPTVKPLDLMRWLVRLVTPPGGTVLEPFAGSGTTAEACVLEHMHCIAVEREADYLPLIVQRVSKPLAVGFDLGALS